MAEQNEYLVAGKRKDTGEMLSTTVLAGDDSEAVSVAENLGIDVERVEYVRTKASPAGSGGSMTPGRLFSLALLFLFLTAVVALLGVMAQSGPGLLFAWVLGGILNVLAVSFWIVGLVRLANAPLQQRLEQMRTQMESLRQRDEADGG